MGEPICEDRVTALLNERRALLASATLAFELRNFLGRSPAASIDDLRTALNDALADRVERGQKEEA